MTHFVYVLESEEDGTYYVGHTSNLKARLERHNQGRSAYTRSKVPWKLVYSEPCQSKSDASKREREIKGKKGRGYIEYLVRASRV